MIPDYLRDEFVLRLSSPRLQSRKLKAICRLLEIDLDAAPKSDAATTCAECPHE